MNKLRSRPFALVGVDIQKHEPSTLKAVMTKENINWRSFADRGEIVRQWNFPATPTLYIIDPTGVIRHKWVGSPGEKSVDAALEKLIRAVEKTPARGQEPVQKSLWIRPAATTLVPRPRGPMDPTRKKR